MTARTGAAGPTGTATFYGWRIVAVLAVTETVSWGVLYYAFSVLLLPMQADLGLSTATLTGAFSLSVLLTGIGAVPVARWLDAHGPRALMTTGSVVAALLVVAWSRVDSVLGLYAVFAAIGLVRASVLYEPAFAVVVRWFDDRRSTALLAVTVVAGLASTIFLPLTDALVDVLGWRDALLALAGILAGMTILPHWLVLRRDPSDLGLRPDGGPAEPRAGPGTGVPPGAGSPRPRLRRTVRWALGDVGYRWYAVAFAANALAVVVVAVHLVPLLREQGHSGTFAAAAAGSLGAMSVTGRLVMSGATRSFSPVRVTAVMFALQGAAVVVLLAAGRTAAGAVVFVVLFGLGFGVATVARPALLARTYGTARYATLAALMALVLTAATTAGPVTAGLARTATGSYTVVLISLVVLCGVSAAALLRAGSGDAETWQPPARPERRQP